MNTGVAKKLLPLTVPLGLTVLTHVLYLNAEKLPAQLLTVSQQMSYPVFLLVMFLSCWFNRSRLLFVSAVLALSQLALTLPAPAGADRILYLNGIYSAACFLIPLNVLVFSLLKERGILTSRGKVRIGFILVQALYTLWAARSGPGMLAGMADKEIFSLKIFSLTPIPQAAVLLFAAVFSILLARFLITGSAMEGSFAGVILAVAFALHLKDQYMALPLFFAAAGIMLAVAVLQDSYSKAYLDELTGLPGRRALREEMAKLDRRYTVAMVDIDFFKNINDTYGHDVGDEVLKYIATMIRSVSGGGRAFRYGGEEFTVIFPGRRLKDVVSHLEELREAISKRPFTLRGKDRPKKKPSQAKPARGPSKRIYITVSVGVSENSGALYTPEDVIAAADEALYRAKDEGRNRVCQ